MESNKHDGRQRAACILFLVIVSPVIAEVLFGSTPVSMIYLLIPQICIYGGAALMIHSAARRRGWTAMWVLGLAFAIAEECIILQTSVSPPYQHLLFGSAPNQNYLGILGINWAYLLWALGYESVWAILLPIVLLELVFPDRPAEPWIGRRGFLITALLFLVPSYGVWYTFTQNGILPGLAYEAPLSLILASLAIILLLVIFVLLLLPASGAGKKTAHPVPAPWQVGVVTFFVCLPWFSLAILPYLVPGSVPTAIWIMIGGVWAAAAFRLFRVWSSSTTWQERHRLAVVFGALLASMLAGFIITGPTLSPFDLQGKIILNLIALLLLIVLAYRVRQRTASRMWPQVKADL